MREQLLNGALTLGGQREMAMAVRGGESAGIPGAGEFAMFTLFKTKMSQHDVR